MRKLGMALFALGMLVLSSCATNYKAQLNALGQFNYNVQSVDQLRLAGRDINSFSGNQGVSLSSLPGIAFALLKQDLPLQGRVNLQITNPTKTLANINEFKYIVEFSGKPLFEGSIDENIKLATGETMVLPLSFSANIFNVAKEQGLEKVVNDIFTRDSNALLALKIKPSIKVGNKNIFYPGYITVDKDLGKGLKKIVDKATN